MKKILFFLFTFSILQLQALTLQEAIEESLKNHPDIHSLELRIKQSTLGYKSSKADYLPQIHLSANYNPVQTFVFPQNGAFHTVDDQGWSAGVSVVQKIWDFSKTSSLIKASKQEQKIAQLSYKDLKALLAYKVKVLYYTMIVKNEAILARKEDLKAKEEYYKQALSFVEEGLKTKVDATRFLSALYLAKDALEQEKAEFIKARKTLFLYMNKEDDPSLTLQNSSLYKEPNLSQNTILTVFAKNISLQLLQESIEKNHLIHKATKASGYGSVDAVLSYSHLDTLNSYDTKVAGVVLSIPLYTGGRLSAETQKAQISYEIAQTQKHSKELSLQEEINSLLIDIGHYNKTIEAKKAQMQASNETLKLLEARYHEGLATYIEVLDARALYLNAKLGLTQAYFLRSVALAKIAYLKGEIYE